MPITATNEGGGNYAPLEAGTYPARCYSMVHIGTIQEEFQGEKKTMNKVRISWELPTELKEFKQGEGEKPYVLSKEFTLSLHEKSSLRAFLKSWRGKDFTEDEAKSFDVTKLLSVTCMLSVGHKESKGKVYAEINSVSPTIKGFNVPAQINPSFELNYDNFTMEAFMTLPEFIRKKMEGSLEFKKIQNLVFEYESQKQSVNQNNGEDLPF
jgi:hypothetical protein